MGARGDWSSCAAAGDTMELLVAAQEIPIGARIEASHVRTTRWPIDAQPEGALKKPEEAIGQIARMTIEKNRPVVGTQLVSQGVGLLPMLITEGMRAMSVKVDSVTGVSGFITPNSRVDVLVAGKPEGRSNDEERSKLILQNVRVLFECSCSFWDIFVRRTCKDEFCKKTRLVIVADLKPKVRTITSTEEEDASS